MAAQWPSFPGESNNIEDSADVIAHSVSWCLIYVTAAKTQTDKINN